jgi:hypothetical protein
LHEQPCVRAQPLLLACRGRVFLHAFSARVLMNFHMNGILRSRRHIMSPLHMLIKAAFLDWNADH